MSAPTNETLSQLDDLLMRVRVATQRPEYRRRLLDGFEIPGGISTLRLLRAVEALEVDAAPSIRDVASRLALEHSTVSRLVEVAVRSGFLTKQPCEQDLRRALLTLTEEGRTLLDRSSRRRCELVAQVTDGWTDDQLDQLVQQLGLLCEGFDELEAGA
jgi:DNA-binding MarR family transcriptional regulator